MNFEATSPVDDSQLRRAVSGIGRSAEYSIAIALFGVCLVAGGTLWFLNLKEPGTVQLPPPSIALESTTSTAPDEKATVEALQRGLDEKFDQLDQKRRVEEAAAERARSKAAAEEAAAEAAAKAQAEEAARKIQLASATKAAAAVKLQPARVAQATPPPPPAAVPVQPKIETAAAAPVTPKAAHTDAAIDWSSCKRPPYPTESVKRMEEGTTIVKVDLDPTGAILGSSIAQSSGFSRLDGATQRAVMKCQFTAATVDGVAQASSASVRIAWSLGQQDRLFGR